MRKQGSEMGREREVERKGKKEKKGRQGGGRREEEEEEEEVGKEKVK
jgi:hypothetical protein